MHYKNVFPLVVYLKKNPTMIILKVIILKEKKSNVWHVERVYFLDEGTSE